MYIKLNIIKRKVKICKTIKNSKIKINKRNRHDYSIDRYDIFLIKLLIVEGL